MYPNYLQNQNTLEFHLKLNTSKTTQNIHILKSIPILLYRPHCMVKFKYINIKLYFWSLRDSRSLKKILLNLLYRIYTSRIILHNAHTVMILLYWLRMLFIKLRDFQSAAQVSLTLQFFNRKMKQNQTPLRKIKKWNRKKIYPK